MNGQCQFVETIKVCDGAFYNLPSHLERIRATTRFFWNKSIDITVFEKEIPTSYRKGLFKCRFIYSDTNYSIEYEPYSFRTLYSLALVEDNDIEYVHKSLNRVCFDRLLDKKGNADDILIVKNGLITDTSYSNVVFEDSSGLYTPDSYLLNGTKRRLLLKNRIVEERRITSDDIRCYDKLYLINAMIDISDSLCISVDDIN